MKPEVVAHGGNINTAWSTNPVIGAYGLDETGTSFAFNVGTSFSAPIISSYAARIFHEYPDADVNLVKALLIHFAVPFASSNPSVPGLFMCGFGEPNINACFLPVNSAATFIYQGEILKDTYNEIPFYVPDCMAEDKDSILKIKVTLVYNPPVDSDNILYYSQTKIGVELHKATSYGIKKVSFTNTDERYVNEWSPVVSLQKEFSRSYASGDWFVKVRSYGRSSIPRDFLQDYSLIVEVIDNKGKAPVYNGVEQNWSVLQRPSSEAKVA